MLKTAYKITTFVMMLAITAIIWKITYELLGWAWGALAHEDNFFYQAFLLFLSATITTAAFLTLVAMIAVGVTINED